MANQFIEMFVSVTLITKLTFLSVRKMTSIINNRASSWLETNSLDEVIIPRWIKFSDKHDNGIEHRPCTKHGDEPFNPQSNRNSATGEPEKWIPITLVEALRLLPLSPERVNKANRNQLTPLSKC